MSASNSRNCAVSVTHNLRNQSTRVEGDEVQLRKSRESYDQCHFAKVLRTTCCDTVLLLRSVTVTERLQWTCIHVSAEMLLQLEELQLVEIATGGKMQPRSLSLPGVQGIEVLQNVPEQSSQSSCSRFLLI